MDPLSVYEKEASESARPHGFSTWADIVVIGKRTRRLCRDFHGERESTTAWFSNRFYG
jgi:hypothetical protein